MKRQKEAAQKETLKRILGLIRPYWWMAALILLFAVITVAATLYGPILIGQGVDLIIGQGNVDFAGLRSLILQFLLMIAVTGISQWLMSLMTNRITYQVVRDMRVQAFNRMEELPLKYMDNHQPGDALSRIIPSFHPLDLLVGLCCGAGLRLAVYLKGKNAKKYRHGSEYGSARWSA